MLTEILLNQHRVGQSTCICVFCGQSENCTWCSLTKKLFTWRCPCFTACRYAHWPDCPLPKAFMASCECWSCVYMILGAVPTIVQLQPVGLLRGVVPCVQKFACVNCNFQLIIPMTCRSCTERSASMWDSIYLAILKTIFGAHHACVVQSKRYACMHA